MEEDEQTGDETGERRARRRRAWWEQGGGRVRQSRSQGNVVEEVIWVRPALGRYEVSGRAGGDATRTIPSRSRVVQSECGPRDQGYIRQR